MKKVLKNIQREVANTGQKIKKEVDKGLRQVSEFLSDEDNPNPQNNKTSASPSTTTPSNNISVNNQQKSDNSLEIKDSSDQTLETSDTFSSSSTNTSSTATTKSNSSNNTIKSVSSDLNQKTSGNPSERKNNEKVPEKTIESVNAENEELKKKIELAKALAEKQRLDNELDKLLAAISPHITIALSNSISANKKKEANTNGENNPEDPIESNTNTATNTANSAKNK